MKNRTLGLARDREAAEAQSGNRAAGVQLGRIVALALPDAVWVELEPGQAGTRTRARVAMDCDVARLQRAVAQQEQAVLALENGDVSRPILLGIIAAPRNEMREVGEPGKAPLLTGQAEIDGERVHLRAQQEIVLQCGDASISLRRDGRVTIRGAYVETNARTTNRIKGGNVRIN
jgi:hypothetical protein